MVRSSIFVLLFFAYTFCISVTTLASQLFSSEDDRRTELSLKTAELLRNISTTLNEQNEDGNDFGNMTAYGVSTGSFWTNFSYRSPRFRINGNITLAYWRNGILTYMPSDGSSNTTLAYSDFSTLRFKVVSTNEYQRFYMVVTVKKLDDGHHEWSNVEFNNADFYTSSPVKEFRTKDKHAYNCDPPATVLLDKNAMLLVSDLYYFVSFDQTDLPIHVDGCQGSLTYKLYGTVGGISGLLSFVTVVVVVIRYRRIHKLRTGYENLDRRFQP